MTGKISILVVVFLLSSPMLLAMPLTDDLKNFPTCKYCGMDRKTHASGRVVVHYADGKSEGLCSIHCGLVDVYFNSRKTLTQILVADYHSTGLIDADTAFWVIGGGKHGTMSKRAKWAFLKKEDAERFIKTHGGGLANFDHAIKAVFDDMYHDTKIIHHRAVIVKKMREPRR